MTAAPCEHMTDIVPFAFGPELAAHLDARSAEGWELFWLEVVTVRHPVSYQAVPGTGLVFRRPKAVGNGEPGPAPGPPAARRVVLPGEG